jgi:hypothetical protein
LSQISCVGGYVCPSGSTQPTSCVSGSFRDCTASTVHYNCADFCVVVLGNYNMAPWNNVGFPDTYAKFVWSIPGATTSVPAGHTITFSKTIFIGPCHECFQNSSVSETTALFYLLVDGSCNVFVNNLLVERITSGSWLGSGTTFTVTLRVGFNTLKFVAGNQGFPATAGPAGIAFAFYCRTYIANTLVLLGHSDGSWCLGDSCNSAEISSLFNTIGQYTDVTSTVDTLIGVSPTQCPAGSYCGAGVTVATACASMYYCPLGSSS